MVVTWRTHKTAEGYEWTVYEFGYQVPNNALKTGVCRTRAQATERAKKWTLYFKRSRAA